MIYLENKTLLQDVYIPRQDMLPYTTGSSGTYAEGYSDGYEDGTQDQKDKLASTAFTENGLYTREDGWNEVEVSVEAPLPVLEDKTVVISADTTTVTPSSGYDGMSQVIVDASEYAQENYDGGFEDGFEDGYSSGSTDEKAKLSGVTFTANTQVSLDDGGYSAVTVNVPQTGHTDQELEDAYESGYTSGQTDQKNLLTTTAFTENGSYQRENGWSGVTVNIDTASTYNSGYTDGYDSGYTSGETHQKSLLVSTAFTENGEYQRENGYSAITVNVPTGQTYNIEENKPFTATSNGSYTIEPSNWSVSYSGNGRTIIFEKKGNSSPSAKTLVYDIEYSDNPSSYIEISILPNGIIDYDDDDWNFSKYGGFSWRVLNNLYYIEFYDVAWIDLDVVTETNEGRYDVMSAVSLNVNVDTASTYNSGYTSGYTDGYEEAFDDVEYGAQTLSVSANGTYNTGLRVDGYLWDEVIVNVPQTGSTDIVMCVSGGCWFNMNYTLQYGDQLELNHSTFGKKGATQSYYHQQLVGGNNGEYFRIGQGENNNIYSTYFNTTRIFNQALPETGSYFEDDTILLNSTALTINGNIVTSYTVSSQISQCNLVLFANTVNGNDVVENQTAKLGIVRIYGSDGTLKATFEPRLDDFNVPYYKYVEQDIDIYASGNTQPFVEVISECETCYQEGYDDGENAIIGTFSSMTATTNGVYGSSAHPLSSITVNVPQSGGSGTTKIFFADYIHTDTLQETSSDRIDTGIYPTTATTFRVKGLGKGLPAGNELVGFNLYDAGEESDYRLFCYSTSGEILGFDWYSERITNENWGGLTDGKSIDFTCSNYQVYDNINETVLISGSPQSNMAQGIPIYVNVGSWWLKGLEIWEGNTKVFDGVAAYDDSGNIGLYDSVSNALVTNTGLTMVYEFDSGSTLPLTSISITANTAISVSDKAYTAITVNVPQISAVLGTKLITSNGTYSATTDSLDGYSAITVNVSTGSDVTYVEYLETDGSEISWDTGVKLTDLDEVVYFDFAPLTGTPTGDAFFAFLSQQQNDFNWALAIRTNVAYRFDSVITQFGNKSQYINYTEGVKNTCILSKTGATVNGVDYQTSSSSVSTTSWNIIINGQKNDDGPVFMRFPVARYYGFKIMSGETAVIDLKPALDGNNVPCFYDEISKTYIYHTGSGTPIAGPIVHYSDYMSGFTDGYASGFTDGYNSGLTDGYASGYTDGYASGLTDGYASGFTDGYNSGYTDGYNSGYTSGYTDGQNNIIGTFSSMTATTNGVYGSSANPLSSITVDVQTADYGELIGLYCTNNCQFVITPATTANLINTEIAFGIRSGNASMKITSGASLPNANRIIVDNNGNVTGNSYSYGGSGGVSTGSGQTSVVLNSFPNKNYMYIDRNGANSINYVNSLSASTCNNYSSTPGNNMLLSIDDGYFYIGYFNAQNAYETAACLFPNVDTDGNACIRGNNNLFYPISGECYPIYKNGNNYYVLMKSQPWNHQ